MTKVDLADWVLEALRASPNGEASLVEIARHIWENHRSDLEKSGDMFYTWQYDMRWAAQVLRNDGRLRASEGSPRGVWPLPAGRR